MPNKTQEYLNLAQQTAKEVSNIKKRTKNHGADADRIFMLVKNHVLAASGMGDEAPPTPGGRNGGSDVL